ncbi:MAG: FAD-binding protein [Betaproteobacteria bacterium]
MGGIRVDSDMKTSVPHLFAAGEALGGANGANRLSGNAISEAFVFGRRAGQRAAEVDRHDLRNMRLVAECIARAALARTESRGAHQREDFPETSDAWLSRQNIRLTSEGLRLDR